MLHLILVPFCVSLFASDMPRNVEQPLPFILETTAFCLSAWSHTIMGWVLWNHEAKRVLLPISGFCWVFGHNSNWKKYQLTEAHPSDEYRQASGGGGVPTEPNQARKWRYIVVIGRPGSATSSVGGTFEPLCSHMSESSQTVFKVPSSSNTNMMQTLGMETVFRETGYIYSCNCQPLNSQWAASHWAKCWGFKADCVQICSIPDNFK